MLAKPDLKDKLVHQNLLLLPVVLAERHLIRGMALVEQAAMEPSQKGTQAKPEQPAQ